MVVYSIDKSINIRMSDKMSDEIHKLYMKYFNREIKKDTMTGKLYFIDYNRNIIFIDE